MIPSDIFLTLPPGYDGALIPGKQSAILRLNAALHESSRRAILNAHTRAVGNEIVLRPYVNSNCRQGANPVASIGSNEAGLSCPSSCVTNVDESIFVDASLGDLHLKSTAPTSITAGGTTQFTDSVGQVPIPTTDIDGLTRGASAAIGAFNPSP